MRLLLRDLSRALLDAISDSHEVHRGLQRLRREGYRLQLLLDCKPETVEDDAAATQAAVEPQVAALDPTFLINGQDLSFLRSIGIDPTRRRRRRSA